MPDYTNLDCYDYILPPELVAQTPLDNREQSKMLIFDRKTKQIKHKHFFDIVNYLKVGDVLVLNNSRVIPARIFGKKENGVNIECLLLKRQSIDSWEVLLKPAKRLKIDQYIIFSDKLKAKLTKISDDGNRILQFEYQGVFEDILNEIGQIPLPPYIHKKLDNAERYQTVYNKIPGSAAAPTAGLHFTDELLEKIKDLGVIIVNVTLNVGLGTFRPCKEQNIKNHIMHSEYFTLSAESAQIVNLAKKENRRVIAVGTTAIRVLESVARMSMPLKEYSGDTDIFIYPPYKFMVVDALITNFHLPKSTLLMLISAFAGLENVKRAYQAAIDEKYRFFSFGDCCLFL